MARDQSMAMWGFTFVALKAKELQKGEMSAP